MAAERIPSTRGNPEWTVASADAGVRLDKFLADPARLGSRARATAAIERRKVFVNGDEIQYSGAGRRLAPDDVVRVWMDRPGSARTPGRTGRVGALNVVYEDDVLIVVNKPAGVLSVPLPRQSEAVSMYELVDRHLRSRGARAVHVVHRIDRDTSGLVVFARSAAAWQSLKRQFRRHEAERIYLAVVYGHPNPTEGTWRDSLVWDERALVQKATHPEDPEGSEAISHYKVLERFAETSLLEVRLKTGRRNQIRLQARLRGHTLVGEQRYTYGPEALRPIPFERQALHAARLAFTHPISGKRLEFEAPLPQDMTRLIDAIRRGHAL